MWTREMLKTNAKTIFYRNYWPCVGVAFIMSIISEAGAGSSSSFGNQLSNKNNIQMDPQYSRYIVAALLIVAVVSIVIALLNIFVGNILLCGGYQFFIKNRTGEGRFNDLANGFKNGHYWNIVKTLFLMDLYIFLWSLLFIIPGIVKSYEYLMVPFILAENPGMETKEIFAISKRMMSGQKGAAFVLDLSFIGWILLSILTCGLLLIFYVEPYIWATKTELYAFNKAHAYNEGYIR